jgi:hypothetical protein
MAGPPPFLLLIALRALPPAKVIDIWWEKNATVRFPAVSTHGDFRKWTFTPYLNLPW